MGYEAHTTGVVFVTRIIKALGLRKSHRYKPILSFFAGDLSTPRRARIVRRRCASWWSLAPP
jgi:hypothetical protein